MRHAYGVSIGKMPLSKDRSSGVFGISNPNTDVDAGFIPPDWSEEFQLTEADIRNYTFEFEKRIEKSKNLKQENSSDTMTSAPKTNGTYSEESIRLKPVHYRLNFSLQKLQSQVSNAFGSKFYRAYDGTTSFNPGIGNATEIRISDLFDDYHIIGGFNIPANLRITPASFSSFNIEKNLS